MPHVTSRRGFLAGRCNQASPPRPFGAVADIGFPDLCTQCGACARACPERIIKRGRDGYPVIDIAAGACTFCAACSEACETGALRGDVPWPWRAEAGADCLSLNGVFCRACEDQCEPRAIRFRPGLGGRSVPRIDHDTCTGCGACAAPCPVGAIALTKVELHKEPAPC